MIISALTLAMALAATPSVDDATPWYEHYESGLRLLEAGDAVGAREELDRALEKRSEGGLRLRTHGVHYIDYLPHLYLAIAAHLAGDPDGAQHHLAAAELSGLARRSLGGNRLLEAYRPLISPPAAIDSREPSARPEGAGEPPRHPPLERRAYPRHREYERRTLAGCGRPAPLAERRTPWYLHYEHGLMLKEQGDPRRALEALIASTARRPEPERSARMYGMWFIDYLPYYEMAQLHLTLGNRACATEALRLSAEKGEISPSDGEYAAFLTLQRDLQPIE
jgi:hypothetical protein